MTGEEPVYPENFSKDLSGISIKQHMVIEFTKSG